MKLVGIDLSTEPTRCGLCVLENRVVTCVDSGKGTTEHPHWLLAYCTDADVVAIDVPFGWPKPFTRALADYHIGVPLTLPRAQYRLRTIDLWVKDTLPPVSPKSVSTDQLGATAIVGTNLVYALGNMGFKLSPAESGEHPAVIEVYPAASLCAWSLLGHVQNEVLAKLEATFGFMNSDAVKTTLLNNAHCYDALIAVLTAWEYMCGNTFDPDEQVAEDTLRAKGWIRVPSRSLDDASCRIIVVAP